MIIIRVHYEYEYELRVRGMRAIGLRDSFRIDNIDICLYAVRAGSRCGVHEYISVQDCTRKKTVHKTPQWIIRSNHDNGMDRCLDKYDAIPGYKHNKYYC